MKRQKPPLLPALTGPLPLLNLCRSLTINEGSTADAQSPVLPLTALNAVHLPGGGPEDGGGSPWKVAADEAPEAAILPNSLPIVTGQAGGTPVTLYNSKYYWNIPGVGPDL